jgi:hypothetical protein
MQRCASFLTSAPDKEFGVWTIRLRTIHPKEKIMLFDLTNLT